MTRRRKQYWMPLTAIAIFAICLVTSAMRHRARESEMAFLGANEQSAGEKVESVQGEPIQVEPVRVEPANVEPARHDANAFVQGEPMVGAVHSSLSPPAELPSDNHRSQDAIQIPVGIESMQSNHNSNEFGFLEPTQSSPDQQVPVQPLPDLHSSSESGEGTGSLASYESIDGYGTLASSGPSMAEPFIAEPALGEPSLGEPSFQNEQVPFEQPETIAARNAARNVVVKNEFVAADTAYGETTGSAQAIEVVEFDAPNSQVDLVAAQSIDQSRDSEPRLAKVEPATASDPGTMFKPAPKKGQLPVPGGKSKLPQPGGKSNSKSKDKVPAVLSGLNEFKLAAQPEMGAHFKDDRPLTDPTAHLIDASTSNFSPGPSYDGLAYEPFGYMNVYQGKTLNANQRPLIELGRPWYQLGQLSPGSSVLGFHNNVNPQFIVFGDSRVAYASNTQNGDSVSQIATVLNLDLDLKITATERFHAFISPNSGGGKFTRWLMDDDEIVSEADANIDFGYFEGDMGAIVGGFTNKTLPFDLPFAVGVMPLFFQNGVWMNDAVLGVAVTIPARNSAKLDITNMDITFFAAYDKVVSDAFPGDDSAARMFGVASFIEALNGYFEIDYAFLDDRTFDDRSYHNIGIGYTRRWGRFISNSTRVIVNTGQSTDVVENTADGVLLLSENSLITGAPSTVVPYMNFFAGFDRPQSAARAGAAGGVLNNTGILFESDNLTNYPTLDASANDTYGMALGTNLLTSDFSQQLVVEAAMVGVMGDDATRKAKGDQYGLGVRYQIPLTNSIIFRTDAMKGFLRGDDDVHGVRMELRKKF